MNTVFNGADRCTPKKQAQQLIVELSKSITTQQRQALLDIYIALDRAEAAEKQPVSTQKYVKPSLTEEEFWEASQAPHPTPSYADYPTDWLRRVNQKPNKSHTDFDTHLV